MSDKLSQAELDDLLEDMKQGSGTDPSNVEKTESGRIRQYDFSKPNIFGRDQMRMLNLIHDEYGGEISGFMTRYLKSPFKVELEGIEAMTYRDFNIFLPKPTVLSVIDVTPLKGSMILDFPPKISSVIIDSVLGGMGDCAEEIYEFTDIEISILKGILEQLTEMLKKPWEKIIAMEATLERIETDPQMLQLASPLDVMIVVTYKAYVNGVEDSIRMCIPHQVIEPIAAGLGSKQWQDQANEEVAMENDRGALRKKLSATSMDIRVELGKNKITLGDLTNLQPGDVISLGKNINSSLELYVGDSLKFKGKPGISNSKYSVEISEIIKNNRQV